MDQIRRAFAIYHGSAEGLTLAQMDTRAEGIFLSAVQGPGGMHFDIVSIGFGGGNGAQILFAQHSTRMAGVQIVDGAECLDLD